MGILGYMIRMGVEERLLTNISGHENHFKNVNWGTYLRKRLHSLNSLRLYNLFHSKLHLYTTLELFLKKITLQSAFQHKCVLTVVFVVLMIKMLQK